jgi:phytoene synthase
MPVTVTTASWEERLLALAYGELCQDRQEHRSIDVETATLRRAYKRCTAITREHSKTFYMASALMPPGKRRAVRALYAFCRVTDDLVDQANGDIDRLGEWRWRALADFPATDDLVPLAWADTRFRYRIPVRYARQLLDGVARDIYMTRYATFADLAEYAYGVASTVGLMSMHIAGYVGPEAVPYAVRLGVALQLTNILRDVGEDWRNGRLYLPQDELADFGLSEADIAAGRVDDRWRRFMRFQIARNRRLYSQSLPGVGLLRRDGRFSIAAAAELYREILADIEIHDYDVFQRRSYVSTWGKLRRLPGIWRRALRGYRTNGQAWG